jgi:hypothetical protein
VMTAIRDSPATAGTTGNASRISGTFIYGYDSAGNPTLTDGC